MKRFITLLISLIVLSTPCLAESAGSNDDWSLAEQALWDLETAYITLLKDGDTQGLTAFWHEKFVGWPSHTAAPVSREDAATSIEELLHSMKISAFTLHPHAIRIIGGTAIVHYLVNFEIENSEGVKQKNIMRITHTWMKENENWRIVGGMSSRSDVP